MRVAAEGLHGVTLCDASGTPLDNNYEVDDALVHLRRTAPGLPAPYCADGAYGVCLVCRSPLMTVASLRTDRTVYAEGFPASLLNVDDVKSVFARCGEVCCLVCCIHTLVHAQAHAH